MWTSPEPSSAVTKSPSTTSAAGPVIGKRNHLERTQVAKPGELPSGERPHRAQLREGRRALGGAARERGRAGGGQDQAPIAHLVLAVLEVGMRRHGDVRQQRPGRRGPDQQLARRVIGEREGHVHRVGGDLLVAERQLVAREHRAAPGAVRQHAVAAIEQVALMQPAEQPPDRLDVVLAARDVRMLVVEPVADPVGQRFPIPLVLEDAVPRARVELRHAEPLDFLYRRLRYSRYADDHILGFNRTRRPKPKTSIRAGTVPARRTRPGTQPGQDTGHARPYPGSPLPRLRDHRPAV